jgi:hypothetical protein
VLQPSSVALVRKESIVPYLQPEGTRSIVDRDATCYAALLCFALLCFALLCFALLCSVRYALWQEAYDAQA